MTAGPLTPPVARLLALVNADRRTRAAVAAAAGMSPAQFSQILTGHRADPSITTVGRILAALGKSWRHLEAPKVKALDAPLRRAERPAGAPAVRVNSKKRRGGSASPAS